MKELKKILCDDFFNLSSDFSKHDIRNLLKNSSEHTIIKYFIDKYSISKALHIIDSLYKFSDINKNTLFYLDLIKQVPEINNYCENTFINNPDIIDAEGNISLEYSSNEFVFNIIYAYAIKNNLIQIDDEAKKENEIIKKIKEGNNDLLNDWLIDNKNLIYEYARKYSAYGIDIEDLFQEGSIGVITAIEKYNPDLNFRFSTYAVWWIRNKILRYIYNNKRSIRIPIHMGMLIEKMNKIKKEYEEKFDEEPTIEYLASKLNVSIEKVKLAIEANESVISLNAKVDDDDRNGSELCEIIPTKINTEEEAFKNIKREEVIKFINNSSLTDREKEIIFLRFGLIDGVCKTLEDLGVIYNITRERVRQIEIKALRKLRHTRDRLKVIDFMDGATNTEGFVKKISR